MPIRIPLSVKIVTWFFLNLALLGLGFLFFFRANVGFDSLLSSTAKPTVLAIGKLVSHELNTQPTTSWDHALERFDSAYNMHFALYRNRGIQIGGKPLPLPRSVQEKVHTPAAGRPPPPPPVNDHPPERGNADRRPQAGHRPPPRNRDALPEDTPMFVTSTVDPPGYWAGVGIPVVDPLDGSSLPVMLILHTNSLALSGPFFDAKPWLIAGFGAVLLSVLFWFPLVHGLTRTLRKVTQATAQVAEGNFQVHVPDRRRDELGALGRSVNVMAERLANYVYGQKRFLGDVAHELCSPIARLQISAGIMEQNAAGTAQAPQVERMSRELAHMSELVSELLSFSKADLQRDLELRPAKLAPLVQRAVDRESTAECAIHVSIHPTLIVVVEPDLLVRATANVLRNALRYAGAFCQIHVSAEESGEEVHLRIRDEGPGVPPEALPKLFDAFYRPDAARQRETGGVGLGLAIVKSCVEACHGSVTARNVSPRGFEVALQFINGR